MMFGRNLARRMIERAESSSSAVEDGDGGVYHGRLRGDAAILMYEGSKEIERLCDVIRTRDKAIEQLQAQLFAVTPNSGELIAAVRARMNAESPPGLGVSDRGAELAILAVTEFMDAAFSACVGAQTGRPASPNDTQAAKD